MEMFEDKNQKLTPVSEFGEFGLINHLTEHFKLTADSSVLGIGDDAAILDPKGQQLVATTDILVEGVHFNLGYVPLKHLGYKAVAVNVSDVVAMNAKPTQVLVSIAASNRFPVEAFEEVYAGIALACEHYHVDLVGGDTSSSTTGLILNITAFGVQQKEKIVKRSGAKPNDLLVVTGDLGAAFMGLKVLEREHELYLKNPSTQPEMEGYNYILERQLKPEARTDIKKIFEESNISPTSMIDISDGLASEILHLSKSSEVGFRLYEEKIPLDPEMLRTAEEFKFNPVLAALSGGEDYELLFTLDQQDYDKIKNHPDFTVIGHAVDLASGNFMVARGSGQLIALTAQGWNAYPGKE